MREAAIGVPFLVLGILARSRWWSSDFHQLATGGFRDCVLLQSVWQGRARENSLPFRSGNCLTVEN